MRSHTVHYQFFVDEVIFVGISLFIKENANIVTNCF